MTVQDLKNSKDEIIAVYNERGASPEMLKEFMTAMLEMTEEGMLDEYESPVEYVHARLQNKDRYYYGKKDNSLASKMANAHDNETFNHITKTWN